MTSTSSDFWSDCALCVDYLSRNADALLFAAASLGIEHGLTTKHAISVYMCEHHANHEPRFGFLPGTHLTLDDARDKLAGLHFSQECLTSDERKILHIAEALLRYIDTKVDAERTIPGPGDWHD